MSNIFKIIFLSLFLTACQNDSKVNDLDKKLTAIENKISKMQDEIDTLKTNNEKLEKTVTINEYLRNIEEVAYLTPGSAGYAKIKFDLGVLTVSLEDIKPYANGSKITLSFGNTLSAGINGLKGTFEWGKVDEKGLPVIQLTKSKEVTFSETLNAGSWTKVSVVLDGVPPAEFGFLRLKDFSHSGIKLLR